MPSRLDPTDTPSEAGQPVAWRYRYIRAKGPDNWIVRQSPAHSFAGDAHSVPVEAEPLYSAATVAALEAESAALRDMREAAREVPFIITAWAFAHNIDGAARNELIASIDRALTKDHGNG